jgi:hypothetical protein
MDPVTISMLVSAGASAIQAYNASVDQKKAQQDAQRLGAQLRAIQEADKISGLQVSTYGAELARQSIGQQIAMTVNTLMGAGAAGVLGGIPGVQAMGANAALQLAADLQQQEYEKNRFVASALQSIEGRRAMAEREVVGDQLTGAQMQAYAKGSEKNQSIATGVGALGQAAAAEIGAQPLYKKDGFKVKDTEFGPTEPITTSPTAGMTELKLERPSEMSEGQLDLINKKRQLGQDLYGAGYSQLPPGVILPGQAMQFQSQSEL